MRGIPDLIERRKREIIDRWVESASHAASARGLDRPRLTNLIPDYLSTLGRATGGSPTAEQQRVIETHLSHRLRQGFELSEVLFEFSILARVLGDELTSLSSAERPPPREIARLFEELHVATTVVTKIYSEHLMEDEQLEKRYARLIQDVVSQAIQAGDGGLPVRAQLNRVLGLVREALGADAAALLVYDAETERLISTASNGLDEGALEQYIAEVTPSSFVGKVATEPAAVLVLDAAKSPLGLSQSLKRSGIHSLLGVRLGAAQALVGVLFAGSRHERTFTPSEVRRLESLGDRITLHLENGQLSARLREKFGQLELFVDILAHDLRGPLSTALLSAGRLRFADTDQEATIDKVERSLRRVDHMVSDLLDAHRIAAGEPLPIHCADARLDVLLGEVVDEANNRGRPRVRVQTTGRMHGVFDRELIRRAVWNLIENALKFGDPAATVTVTALGDEHGLVIDVHNEGEAIPRSEQAQLFKPFARLRTGSKQGPSGWGLGLALVEGCASAHGGSVSLQSELGEGTTFRLSIPWPHEAAQPTVA